MVEQVGSRWEADEDFLFIEAASAAAASALVEIVRIFLASWGVIIGASKGFL